MYKRKDGKVFGNTVIYAQFSHAIIRFLYEFVYTG